jgi:CBS domain-containing protein
MMATVFTVMTGDPLCVAPEDLITKARTLIKKHGFRSLPVVKDGKLAGILSRSDIMKVSSRKTNLTVSGLMNRHPETVSEEDDIMKAAALLIRSDAKQVIVAEGTKLKGIVSSIDLLIKILETGMEPKKKKVSDIMNKKADNASPEDEVAHIWNMMMERSVDGLPVVKDKKVVGVITRLDIIGSRAMPSAESGKTKKTQIEKIMSSPAITVTPETSIEKAGAIMVEKDIVMMPVADSSGSFVGAVNMECVIGAYL